MEIPKPLRQRFGKPRFVQSLETESLNIAERRVLPVVASWKRELAQARNEPVEDDALYWRRRLKNANNPQKRKAVLLQIEHAAWEIGATNVENLGDRPSADPEAREFYAKATGEVVGMTEYLDEWLLTSQATAKTKDMHKSDILRFSHKFNTVDMVKKPVVRRWVTEMMNDVGLKPKTVKRILSGIRSYWRYLQSIGIVDEDNDPFSRLEIARVAKAGNPRSSRLPFEPKDVVRLLSEAEERGDDHLADLIRLGMWTGCRVEEICALKIEDVSKNHFTVKNAKTDAGWRAVPIHSKLENRMVELLASSEDGYVLSGLSMNKYGDRSNAVSKRFGNLKTKLGFGHQHVFHSIRKTVITILENAGVSENIVADIVGHEKKTMTYGLYSGGATIDVKLNAIECLEY